MEKNSWKRVAVEWIDANGTEGAWIEERDFPKPVIFQSVGWLVREDIEYIVLAGTIEVIERKEGETLTFGDVSAYPREMVRDMWEV